MFIYIQEVTHTNIFSLSNSCVKVRIEKDTSQNHSQAAPPQIYINTKIFVGKRDFVSL